MHVFASQRSDCGDLKIIVRHYETSRGGQSTAGTQHCHWGLSIFLLIHPKLVGLLQNGCRPSSSHLCILGKHKKERGRS